MMIENISFNFIILNAFIFLGYLKVFLLLNRQKFSFKLLPFFVFIPIFIFKHHSLATYVFEIIGLLFFYLAIKFKNNFLKYCFLAGLTVVHLYTTLLSTNIISWPNRFDRERLIYPQHLYELEIKRQQDESLYLPYRLRPLVFAGINAYSYVFLANVFTFLSLENFYRAFLLVNALFIFLGILNFGKFDKLTRLLLALPLLTSLVVVGIIKTPDTFLSFSASRGLWLVLLLQGVSVSKKLIKFYFPLWLLSILLFAGLSLI